MSNSPTHGANLFTRDEHALAANFGRPEVPKRGALGLEAVDLYARTASAPPPAAARRLGERMRRDRVVGAEAPFILMSYLDVTYDQALDAVSKGPVAPASEPPAPQRPYEHELAADALSRGEHPLAVALRLRLSEGVVLKLDAERWAPATPPAGVTRLVAGAPLIAPPLHSFTALTAHLMSTEKLGYDEATAKATTMIRTEVAKRPAPKRRNPLEMRLRDNLPEGR